MHVRIGATGSPRVRLSDLPFDFGGKTMVTLRWTLASVKDALFAGLAFPATAGSFEDGKSW